MLKVLGVCLLSFLIGYLVMCLQHSTFSVKGYEIRFPDVRTALLQILISSLDSIFAGSALYFLLAHSGEISFPYFMAMFLAAQTIAYITTIPGGLGAFEALMLLALAPHLALETVIVALVMFRIVYYLTPFLAGLIVLSYSEFNARKEILINLHKKTYLTVAAFTPQVFAVLIFFAGILLLFSEALPPQMEGMRIIEKIVPLSLIESSSLFSSMLGVFLLILANGLWKRVDGAYLLSVDTVPGKYLLDPERLELHRIRHIICHIFTVIASKKAFLQEVFTAEPVFQQGQYNCYCRCCSKLHMAWYLCP
jgi:phosphatidylglycerol lysyltransferase